MSARRHFPLILATLSAALAGGLATSDVRAQCSHGGGFGSRGPQGGGFGPGVSQGLITQQLLRQQLLQQQQMQLLQQVRQQQMLDIAKVDRQMRELAKEGPEAIKTALQNPNPDMRLIAVMTVGKYGPALTDDLIERLSDENPSVQQAARRSLVRLSTQRNGKPTKGRSVDFGPALGSNRVAQGISARKWRSWFEGQSKNVADLKDFAIPDSVAVPLKKSVRKAPLISESQAVALRKQQQARE
jgi:hypothetical protein